MAELRKVEALDESLLVRWFTGPIAPWVPREIPAAIGRGDFKPLLAWLAEHIHSQASRWSSAELLRRATGKALDPAIFRSHLERRYLANGEPA